MINHERNVLAFIDDCLSKGMSEGDIRQYLLDDFRDYSRHTAVIFMYTYCDREENRLRNRVGKVAGWRSGTICPDLIPDNRHPMSRKPENSAVRYYDLGRMEWRSFRKDCFVVVSSFLDRETDEYFDDPQQAGLQPNQIIDLKFNRVDRPDTPAEVRNRAKIANRLRDQRERQIRNATLRKTNKNTNNSDQVEKAITHLIYG